MTSLPSPGPVTNAVDLARYLIDTFGEPHVSGYTLVNKTVREIALATGRSPGTVQAHLRQLDDLGLRVDSRRRLYDAGALNVSPAAPPPTGSDPLSVGPDNPTSRTLALLGELVVLQPQELATITELTARVLADTARASATSRDNARSATRREVARTDAVSIHDSEDIDGLIDRAVVDQKGRAGRADRRQRDELLAIIAPLTSYCSRVGLPGVTDSRGLSSRLDPYTQDQIRFAVDKLLVETKAGACLRPIGKLANLASEGREDYFPATPARVRLPGDPARSEPAAPPDPELEPWTEPGDLHQILAQARAKLGGGD